MIWPHGVRIRNLGGKSRGLDEAGLLQNRYCVEHMVKASSQIEQELTLLQRQTEEMSNSLEPLYEGYLKALGAAGKRQLVMAAYHLCTQAYLDRFLALSWDQRNQLQQALQALAGQLYSQLKARREQAQKMSRQPQPQEGLEFLQRLLEAKAAGAEIFSQAADSSGGVDSRQHRQSDEYEALTEEELADMSDLPTADFPEAGFDIRGYSETDSFDSEDFEPVSFEEDRLDSLEEEESLEFGIDEVPAADQRLTIAEEKDLLAALEGLARRTRQSRAAAAADAAAQPLSPIHLMKQQMLLEKAIREVFLAVSEAANELLQKAEVMPVFPKALMAAAVDSQGMGEPGNAVPNVIKMSVRVMQGEALPEEDEDLPERLGRSRRARKGPGRSPEAPSSNRRPRRFVARETVEIEALPELAAISLRLSEVEFTDPTVSAWRSRLRHKLLELKQLGLRYKQTQKALETSQAEDAWRASWTVREEQDD